MSSFPSWKRTKIIKVHVREEAARHGLLPARHGLGLGQVIDETAGGMGTSTTCFAREGTRHNLPWCFTWDGHESQASRWPGTALKKKNKTTWCYFEAERKGSGRRANRQQENRKEVGAWLGAGPCEKKTGNGQQLFGASFTRERNRSRPGLGRGVHASWRKSQGRVTWHQSRVSKGVRQQATREKETAGLGLCRLAARCLLLGLTAWAAGSTALGLLGS